MKRVDGYVYHRIVKFGRKHTPRKWLTCPNQGKRLPPTIGVKCPICGIKLRTRKRGSINKTAAKAKWNEIISLTYRPNGNPGKRRKNLLYLIERVPQIRERLASILTFDAFRSVKR